VSVGAGLETRDLWFDYGEGEAALRGVSVAIPPGAFLAIIGQNGSGKTTLAKHFNGLLRPTRGQVLLEGEDVREKSVGTLARSVGYVFQNPDHQIFGASTREEIAFGPTNLGFAPEEVERRTAEALEFFGLLPYADRPPASLGFGLRRKVSIAAVYAMHTPYLVLDEPTTGLDHKTTVELMDLLVRLNRQGRTIILITHNMRVVAEYAPRCLVLREGQVLADDATRAVFRRHDLLRSTCIETPQVCELGRRMIPHGMRDSVLTVSEFCDAYAELRKLA
jgi:energy-coupling factor transport system ATP-binding protein